MNRLSNNTIRKIASGLSPKSLRVFSVTSKSVRGALKPIITARMKYMYLKRHPITKILAPVNKKTMKNKDIIMLLREYPRLVNPINRHALNYEMRKQILKSLKNAPKTNYVRHQNGGKTFTVRGLRYTLTKNGTLISHQGMRNRVIYINVGKNEV